jgi:hypothetical protein
MPDLKFKSMGSQWRTKGQVLAIINENHVEKAKKNPLGFTPATGFGTAEGGLYSSPYLDGLATYGAAAGMHSAQAVKAQGWVSSNPASTPVWTANIKAGGLHEVAHNIVGTFPPLITTIASAYSGAYISRKYKVVDANEGDLTLVRVRFAPSCSGPTWDHKRPVHGYKMLLSFADTWLEVIFDDTLYSNSGGWHVRHKLRNSNCSWAQGGDHIWSGTRSSLDGYYERSYFMLPRGTDWTTAISCNDLTPTTDSPANGIYLTGQSAGTSGAAPVGNGLFHPQAEVVVEEASVALDFDPLNPNP